MGTIRRFRILVVAGTSLLGLVALLLWPVVGQGQLVVQPGGQPGPLPQPKPKPKDDESNQYSAVQLIEKSEYRQFIGAARDCIKDQVWDDAAEALQTILDNKEDFYARVEEQDQQTGQKVERWTSVKYEANKLLGSMPQEGLNMYEVKYGVRARQLFEEAKKTGNIELLGDVAAKYLHTSIGPDANDLLASYFLDRGQYFTAALRFERLLALPKERIKNRELTEFKAALAYRRAGDVKNFQKVWQQLQPHLQANGGLKVGKQLVATDDLEKLLDDQPQLVITSPSDWPLVRGDSKNAAQASGSPPLLDEILWRRPTVRDKFDVTGIQDEGADAESWINKAILETRNAQTIPVMPGFFPVAVGGKLIYRDYRGLSAVNLHDYVSPDGDKVKAGEVEWKSAAFTGSLAAALANPKFKTSLEQWLQNYQGVGGGGFLNLVYENSLVGTLTSDQTNVYAVDDLAVPLPPQMVMQLFNPNMFGATNVPPVVKEKILENGLHAYNIVTGKVIWRLEGKDRKTQKPTEFQESHFLGAPLPVGGRLYVLNEKNNGELRLITLDPTTGTILPPIQVLGTVDQNARMTHDPNRRIHAVHLAYGEGILICPTNAGEVLGIDLLSRTLAWAYPYREKRPEQNTNPNPGFPGPIGQPLPLTPATWKVAPPVIAEGKVVFTAPDAHSLHCINLRDGILAWKAKRSSSDLFLAAVLDGKVLIVGKNSCTARSLSTGTPLWTVTTGSMPSGQGVASNNVYYLPLQSGEVCAIDVTRGAIKAHNRPSSPDAPKLGNLVFYQGDVLSQTPNEVIAYPQLIAKLEVVKNEVAKSPNNLEKLTLLGELQLADGQVTTAVQALESVLAKNPPESLKPRVRQKLYEALTDLFQVDFQTASTKYMDQYKDLLKVPGNANEEQKRLGHFWRLVGKGWENQGNMVQAYQAYREFSGLRLYQQEGVPTLDDPLRKVPMHVWLRASIAAMFARANPDQRRQLEVKIDDEWAKVRDSREIDAIRGFVAMFDVPFKVGKEARIQLANAIIEKNDRGAFLEAELSLEQLLGDVLGGSVDSARALEALARLEIRKGSGGSMKVAAAYYRRLAAQFPDAVIRDGKTGKALFNELAGDKRFLGYLDPSGSSWGTGKFKYQELAPGTIPAELYGFVYQPQGTQTRATANLRLVVDRTSPNNAQIQLVDLTTNKSRWSQALKFPPSNYQLLSFYFTNVIQAAQNNPNYFPKGRFRYYQVRGHLAVLQIGAEVYCIDMETPRLLWSQTLLDMQPHNQQQIILQQMQLDPEGNPEVMVWNQRTRMRYRMRIGQVGTVQASYVALLKEDELVVLDPLTGNVLWTKSEIPEDTVLFGDDQYIFLVEVNGKRASSGRALRATDGTPVEVNDFSHLYQNRAHLYGRRILAATALNGKLVVRLYDIPTGKDVWQKTFGDQCVLLESPDPNLTGVIDPATGLVTVFDLEKQQEILKASVLNYRITKHDLQDLHRPLLLADDQHFYIALNRPIDGQEVMGGVLASNFGNGLQCLPVNGWLCALHRRAGKAKVGATAVTWKKGDMHWYSSRPIANQMVIVEQFQSLPLLLFSVRYNQANNQPGGSRWITQTQSIDKRTGKWVYCPLEPRSTNGIAPQFNTFQLDVKDGAINMIGFAGILQHFVDDGRPRHKEARLEGPAGQAGAPGVVGAPGLVPPGGFPGPAGFNPGAFPGGAVPPGGFQPGGFNGRRGGVIIINGQIQPGQPPVLPPVKQQ